MSRGDLERFEQINSLISRAWNPMDRRVGTCCFMGHYRRRGHKGAHSDGEGGWGVRENRSKSARDSSTMLPSHSLDVHLFPTKNGPGPGQPKYSDRESGTLTSRRDATHHSVSTTTELFLIFPFPFATNSFIDDRKYSTIRSIDLILDCSVI